MKKNIIRRIAVLTSGGDAPGMNAAIRAVVRQAFFRNLEVLAIQNGFDGLIENQFFTVTPDQVSNIIQRGGTILNSSRSERFLFPSYRQTARENLEARDVDALVLIGGNGSIAGAKAFTVESHVPCIVVPKTIDNDVCETDYAIGFDTACNTAMEAIDKVRDTANAHHRLFFVEVMGRDCGLIALQAGLSSGAEAILIPEMKSGIKDLITQLEKGWERKKSSLIVVVAEGILEGGLDELVSRVKKKFHHYEIRTSTLGHIQRGGSPSCFDRVLATRLGSAAITCLLEGKKNGIVGLIDNSIRFTPFGEKRVHRIDKDLMALIRELSS
jgi:6-phosphofructokinase 1